MASYTTHYPRNTALQTEAWTLTLDEAKTLTTQLPCPKGSYWEQTVARPYRRAKRQHASTVTVFTAGFSSGELSNALYAAGCTIEH